MIVYDPLWETMKKRGVTAYALMNKHGFSNSTIFRLRHNANVSTELVNRLCRILNCGVEDVLLYKADNESNS